MAAISIPGEGERFLGTDPQIPKIKKVTFGFTGSGADVIVDAQETLALINVAAGTFVLDVWANIDTAFTAVVTITIGDGSGAAGFFASADLAPQTAVSTGLFKKASASAEAFAGGKYYAAADTIDAVLAGATPDAGLLSVYVLYVDNLDEL
jgi:hypothetical protein